MSEPKIEISRKEEEPKGKVKALIVEDSESMLNLLKMAAKVQGGFNSDCTDSASEALKILRQARGEGKPFGLIFSDLGLIDDAEGGLKIAKAAKTEGLAEHLILFTGSAGKFEGMSKEKLEEMGINLVIGKPAAFDILVKSFGNAEKIIKSTQASR
jgi:CheY-like chemotaxis protein